MEANKEQLLNCIFSDCAFIEQLLCEDILFAAPIRTLMELAGLLEDTRKRLLEILSKDEEEYDLF